MLCYITRKYFLKPISLPIKKLFVKDNILENMKKCSNKKETLWSKYINKSNWGKETIYME
jgi:hypothetical protein